MKRLVIAVDCDDVLVPSTHQIVEIYNRLYGTNVTLEGAHTSGNPDWGASREVVHGRLHDIQLMEEYAQTKPFDDAIDVCRRLASRHELHLVTARSEVIMHMTQAMLDKYFKDVFAEIEHVGFDGNKGQVCQRLQADVLIDDNYKHLDSARVCGVGGLLWFGDYPWQDGEAAYGVSRCGDWSQVGDEIERITR